MKVGLRLGKCILDIVTGDVLLNDVLVIVTTGRVNPNIEVQWAAIWKLYKYETKQWDIGVHEEVFKYITCKIYNMGKIHQPKIYGGRGHSIKEAWVECMPTLTDTIRKTPLKGTVMPDLLL
jgi:hypothetical protein